MVLIDLQSVLGALGLVSSIAKPVPVVGPVLGGLIGTVGGAVNSTLPAVSGPLNGLLPGLVGAVNVTPDKDGTVRASDTADNSTTFDSASASAADQGGDPCAMSPYSPPQPVYLESFAPYDANQALIYRYRQQQSVNLGSWFVQEQWMVPSLFTCAAGNKQAELDIANGWGSVDNARQVLEKHWDTWITEDDFAYLASIGKSVPVSKEQD
jgi:glucan 1,3-beta-glucosidase